MNITKIVSIIISDEMTRHNVWIRFGPPPFILFLTALDQYRAANNDCYFHWLEGKRTSW